MLNRSASLAMSTSVLKALPGKLDIKRHSPSILYMSTEIVSITVLLYDFSTMNGNFVVEVMVNPQHKDFLTGLINWY